MNFTQYEMKLCVAQSPEDLRRSLENCELLDMIAKALKGEDGASFVVEFNRETTLQNNLFGDWATVSFKKQKPMLFAVKPKEHGNCVGNEIIATK